MDTGGVRQLWVAREGVVFFTSYFNFLLTDLLWASHSAHGLASLAEAFSSRRGVFVHLSLAGRADV